MDIVERLRMYGPHDERSAYHDNDLAADEIERLRAQIAAKDAALRELAAILKRDDDNNAVMMIIADNALAAPARETE